MPTRERLLVVDDHPEMARLLKDQLVDHGYLVDTAHGGAEAVRRLREGVYDAVLSDIRMEQVDGLDVLAQAKALQPDLPVILMTAFGGVESAVEAIRQGAYHYLTKPFRLEEVLVFVRRAIEERRLRREHRSLKQEAAKRAGPTSLVGRSAAMRELWERVERVAQADVPALLLGESGTGKELVARALHQQGPRRERPFVAVNCTALPATLLESELFGHVKGAFSGATAARRGLFVEADQGTLFLDEIGDMPADLQARLLRVLEDGEVRAVGADRARQVDVRVVAATHQDLARKMREGTFRADIYYRLEVAPIRLPPLRERAEDIPLLAQHFLEQARRRNPAVKARALSPELLEGLCARSWPGNVRELENAIERLVLFATEEVVGPSALRQHLPAQSGPSPLERAKQAIVPLRQLESEYIAWAVAECGGNKTRAAELLGIDVSTIHRRERGERG
jgi:two-component system, NtrC family, response regulator HydG